jgi:hypothetical protein
MENKYFKTDYLSYGTRIRKQFLIPFLIFCCAYFFIYIYIGQGDLKSTLLLLLMLGPVYGLLELYNSRQSITEVEFINDLLIITGFNFNSQWKSEVKIADSKIEIKSKGRGRGNVDYYLRVISKDKHIDINRAFNWDYFTLLNIFHEFKKLKGEKIIFDEKYFLDIMEKKANGLSTMDIAFGKEMRK